MNAPLFAIGVEYALSEESIKATQIGTSNVVIKIRVEHVLNILRIEYYKLGRRKESKTNPEYVPVLQQVLI